MRRRRKGNDRGQLRVGVALSFALASLALTLSACGGESPPEGEDAGARMDGASPSADASPAVLCARQADCDDGDYCNGAETCRPGEAGTDARGCLSGTPPCREGQTCDEAGDQCLDGDCTNPDADGDGADAVACGGDDCDDDDPNRRPGLLETCDLVDNDCDERTLGPDGDDDGYVSTRCCNGETCGLDCDDGDDAINVDASEVCDGVDNDCDGDIDEAVTETYYRDRDGDGFGNPDDAEGVREACSAAAGWVLPRTVDDCDDAISSISPSARELCDEVDNDCDMAVDEGCECVDGATRACGEPDPEAEGELLSAGECQVGTQRCIGGTWDICVGAQGPRAETCNERDDDCDGGTDEGVLRTFYRDEDEDGFGNRDQPTFACTLPGGYALLGTDCDDGARAVNPLALEICDGIDNDCDESTDNRTGGCDCLDGATQPCGTNTGACVAGTQTCDALGSWGACVGEVVAVDESARTCNDVDDDCDGRIDEGVNPNGTAYYRDLDGDGYGGAGEAAVRYCDRAVPDGYAPTSDDCDETGARAHLIHPGADYQTEGHCGGGPTNCITSDGAGGCEGSLGGFGTFCFVANFDYDCDGAVEVERAQCTIFGSPTSCLTDRGPATADAANCGLSVPFNRCCFSDLFCSAACPDGTGIQACR